MDQKLKRYLLLMRHGKSDWRYDFADFDRPLRKRGKRAAQRMGAWLVEQNLIPNYILSSPAERASNTAAKLTKAMGLTNRHIYSNKLLYDGGLHELKAALAHCPQSAERVLLIGHNPGLEDLLMYLKRGDLPVSSGGKLLPTATLAILAMPNDWLSLTPGCAEVLSINRPATLPNEFPYNGLMGQEYRQRPAYYYFQSAAIPYRMEGEELQFMLISSSGNNHWGIPKGIVEPGYTPAASAKIEAWEEAGIEGTISDQMLGYYNYQKWGATCTVLVYPILVSRIVDKNNWEENHRCRQWLSLIKAIELIDQEPLKVLIAKLANKITDKKSR